ncbi:hypothetical protein REPUB_Repub02eG0087300 [Reevesia pubescens]
MVLGQANRGGDAVLDEDILADLNVLELQADDVVNSMIKEHSLVGKIVADKNIKIGLLRAILLKAWPVDSLEIHELDRNVFLFVFKEAQ